MECECSSVNCICQLTCFAYHRRSFVGVTRNNRLWRKCAMKSKTYNTQLKWIAEYTLRGIIFNFVGNNGMRFTANVLQQKTMTNRLASTKKSSEAQRRHHSLRSPPANRETKNPIKHSIISFLFLLFIIVLLVSRHVDCGGMGLRRCAHWPRTGTNNLKLSLHLVLFS